MSDESQTLEGATASRRRIVGAFRDRFGRQPTVVVRSPGRVALLGAHIDYSDGWVMPAAIERAIWLAAAPRNDRRWHLDAVDLQQRGAFDIDDLPPPVPDDGRRAEWLDYPRGVAWVLTEAGHAVAGMDVAYGGDLPPGAGVSSSAAVEVACLLAVHGLAGNPNPDRHALARLAQRSENRYLGLQSGIMDPFAALFGRRDQLIFLDCRTGEHELIPLPSDLAVLVMDSGIRRRLSSSGFNDRRAQCRQAVELLRAASHKELSALRDVDRQTFDLHAHRLPIDIRRRAEHAIAEMARVRRAADDLRAGHIDRFGRAMISSHASSRDLYEVSLPELDQLAADAWAVPGCFGAKLMGGGFGGCVAALAQEDVIPELERAVIRGMQRVFDRTPDVFRTRLDEGAQILYLGN